MPDPSRPSTVPAAPPYAGPAPLGPPAPVPAHAGPHPTKLSVVMPAYNEGACIAANLRETVASLESCLPLGTPFEIILVDDGSADDTWTEASGVASTEPRVKVKRLTRNGGKGLALQVGSIYASGDLVAFLDADLDLHPQQLQNLLRVMEETGADVVLGSKLHPDSLLDYPWRRRAIVWAYYLLIRCLFGLPVRDTQTGIKLFTHTALGDVMTRIVIKRFACDLELTMVAHLRGYRIAEAPVVLSFARRSRGIGTRDVLRMLWDTAAIFCRRYLFRYYRRAGTPTQLGPTRIDEAGHETVS